MDLVDGPKTMEQIFAKRFPGERMTRGDRKRIIALVTRMNEKLVLHDQHIAWKQDQYVLEEL